MIAWLYLAAAIASEITGTVALRQSESFSKLIPSIIVIVGYALSFILLAPTLKKLDIGLVYAVWSGVGTAAIATIGIIAFDEPANAIKFVSLALIIIGIVGLNLAGAT
jgi:small multidrug resistance pump